MYLTSSRLLLINVTRDNVTYPASRYTANNQFISFLRFRFGTFSQLLVMTYSNITSEGYHLGWFNGHSDKTHSFTRKILNELLLGGRYARYK